jgi:hypothetical protein
VYGRWWALRDSFSRGFVEVGAEPENRHAVFHLLDDLYRFPMLNVPIHLSLSDWALPLVPAPYIAINLGLTLVAFAIWAMYTMGRDGWRLARGRATPDDLARFVATFTVFWVIIVGALFEIGENARFRIMIQPLLVGLPLVALSRVIAQRRRPASADPTLES